MVFKIKSIASSSLRVSLVEDETEIAHAYLYLIRNDYHQQQYGLMEDVLVAELYRGKGYGKKLVLEIIKEAQRQGCYKLICTSRQERPEVHAFYLSSGFKEHGKEFRIDF